MPSGRLLVLAVFGVFAVVGVGLVVVSAAGGEASPPVAFTAFWLGALGWNAYWWLVRVAVVVTLDNNGLRWEAPLRSGATALHDLVEVRPMRLASNVEVFVRRGGRPVLVMAAKGLRELLAEISRQRPDLPVRLGWQAKLSERVPGRSRLRNHE